jgi:hypothetical protein
VGQGTLSIRIEGLTTRLSQSYSDGANSDEASVVVDSATLKPVSATRTITSATDKDELSVNYTSDGALIKHGDRQSGLTVPEHSYDNDTSLFLWRTVKFEPGFTTAYVSIITNRRDRHDVELRVIGKEQVSVAAGQFAAWRIEIESDNATQTAWYADTPARHLLKYDNDRGTTFELKRLP